MTRKVIHWATGHTGKMVVRATAERPDYEIVGAFTYSADKAGQDLGAVCETRDLGVALTNNRAAILALEADCVLFLAGAEVDRPASVKDICALLASGKNVVTTAAQFIYPKSMGPEVESAIAEACVTGGTTFHGLGVMPGFFAESVPLLLSRLSRRVDRIIAYETLMYDKYPSAYQMFDLMGFGYAPDDPTPVFANAELVGETWRHSAILLADALDLKIDRVENFRETAVTLRDLHVAAGTIKAGTVGAMAFGVRLVCDGEVRAVLQHYTRMAEDLAPGWPSGDGWTIELEGEPSIKAKIEIGTEGSIMPTDDACMATAMHAIHAVPYVIDAKPGILSLADVPPVWGKDAFHIGRPGQRVGDPAPASVLATAGQRLVEERAIALWSSATGRAAVADLIALFNADSNAELPAQGPLIGRSAEEHVFHAALMAASETPGCPHFVWTLSPPRQWLGLDVPGSRFGQDNPDNIYRIATVDPAFRYRISGRFTGVRPCEFSISSLPAQIGDGTVGNTLGIATLDGIDIDADGRFEIIADASPADGRRNHLPIAGAQTLQSRDTLADWATERPAALEIARIDGPAHDDFDAVAAEARMAYLSRTIARFFLDIVQHGMCEASPENSLPPVMSSAARGGLLTQAATLGCYRIAPDEALIITAEGLGARYIGMQIVDRWMISHDYRRRTSSLNHLQVHPEADGRIRWVISLEDPGVHNWLDGSGVAAGAILLRWQQLPGNAQFADAVSTELVKFEDLRAHLPAGTQFVSPAERAAQRDERLEGYLTRIR